MSDHNCLLAFVVLSFVVIFSHKNLSNLDKLKWDYILSAFAIATRLSFEIILMTLFVTG